MRLKWSGVFFLVGAIAVSAAEHKFEFSELSAGQTPSGFSSLLLGEGRPGAWQIVMDEVPPLLPPISPNAPVVTRRPVLAQLSEDATDERFPLLVYDKETYGDFTFTTRFKLVKGEREQMAGVAFRIQDEKNFYVARASGLGNNFRFYKVVDGLRGTLIGPSAPIEAGVWHEMTVECKGNQIRCLLNGKELIPALTDNSFRNGRIGFWTKSDSVTYFSDARIQYTPLIPFAQTLVKDALEKYSRLQGLKVFGRARDSEEVQIIGSDDASELGQPGGKVEKDVIQKGTIYYAKGRKSVTVTLPLRDRNGEPVAAARVIMDSFPGQTQQNAIVRAMPVVKEMDARIQTGRDLVE